MNDKCHYILLISFAELLVISSPVCLDVIDQPETRDLGMDQNHED